MNLCKGLGLLAAFQLTLGAPLTVFATQPPLPATGTAESFMVQKEETNAKTGNVYVTPTRKNEVLFKASIWGAVQSPGVHYMPLGTRLLDALSLAGGPIERADIRDLVLSTHDGPQIKVEHLSVGEALANSEKNPLLHPEDILVVREDRSLEKAGFYLQVGTFALSVIALGLLVRQNNR